MKLISAVAFLVAVFLASGDVSFLFMLLLTGIIIVISGITIRISIRSLRPLVVIIAFTAAISIFWAKGDELIFEYGAVHIYKEGIALAVFMVLRMVCIVSGSFVLLTYTTSPTALTDALESLISPLKRLGVPVHEFAMMMTIALRFVSPLIEEDGQDNMRSEGTRGGFRKRTHNQSYKGAGAGADTAFRICVQTCHGTCAGDGVPLLYRRRRSDEDETPEPETG